MVNRYTADRRVRSDDAYTPDGEGGKRPDRSVIVYAQRAREAFKDVPIVIGGIEASLRRIAHFDYWSEKVRRSILLDAKADLLVYGNGERQICEIAHRLAAGERIDDDHRPARHGVRAQGDAGRLDRDRLDAPRCARAAESARRSVRDGAGERRPPPHAATSARADVARGRAATRVARQRGRHAAPQEKVVRFVRRVKNADRERSVIRMPSLRAGRRRPGAVRARLAHPASRSQPRQRARARAAARRRRRVAQPAAHPAHHAGDGLGVRAALPRASRIRSTARPTSPPTR